MAVPQCNNIPRLPLWMETWVQDGPGFPPGENEGLGFNRLGERGRLPWEGAEQVPESHELSGLMQQRESFQPGKLRNQQATPRMSETGIWSEVTSYTVDTPVVFPLARSGKVQPWPAFQPARPIERRWRDVEDAAGLDTFSLRDLDMRGGPDWVTPWEEQKDIEEVAEELLPRLEEARAVYQARGSLTAAQKETRVWADALLLRLHEAGVTQVAIARDLGLYIDPSNSKSRSVAGAIKRAVSAREGQPVSPGSGNDEGAWPLRDGCNRIRTPAPSIPLGRLAVGDFQR